MKTNKGIECLIEAPERTAFAYEDRFNFFNAYSESRSTIGFKLKGEKKISPFRTLKLNEADCKKVSVLDRTYLFSVQLDKIIDEINYSLYLLDLKDDWNSDGGKPLDPLLYIDSIDFLHRYSEFVLKSYGIVIHSPEINLCPNGSIDLSWTTQSARLLINFKKVPESTLVTFYGFTKINKGDHYIKIPKEGVIDPDNFDEPLAVWMKQLS
jgi:hypothetical protein